MRPFPGPFLGGIGNLSSVVTSVIAGLWFLFIFVLVVGLAVLLVRFLLVATRAAQLYVNEHEQRTPVAPTAPASPATGPVVPPAPPAAPATSSVAVEPPPVEPPTEPTVKPRAPRAPRTPRTPPTA